MLPMYGILMFVGAASAILIDVFKKNNNSISRTDIFFSALFAFIIGIVGAKLFSMVGNIKYIINGQANWLDVLRSGFMFYGGLIFGVIGIILYDKKFKIPVLKNMDALVVGFPLAHALGRIGCFCSGCCHGVETTSPIGVIFTHPLSPNTPIGVPLVPTQLIEAAALLVIFAILMWLSYKKHKPGFLTTVYALLYAVARAIIEIWRGDPERGFIGSLSSSQFISILIIALVLGLYLANFIINKKKQKPPNPRR